MTEQDAINSQAFKVINLLIDQKTEELRLHMLSFQGRVNQAFEPKKYGSFVRTRIHCENPRTNGEYSELPAEPHDFKDMAYSIAQIQSFDREINELQKLKCRLTGDWDFCHGDFTDMINVFGEKLEGL